VLKAHASECTSVVGNQGILVSASKDAKVCIHSYNQGQYEFVKLIDLDMKFASSGLDFMDGRILIGYDNGVIATVDMETEAQEIVSVSHYEARSGASRSTQKKELSTLPETITNSWSMT